MQQNVQTSIKSNFVASALDPLLISDIIRRKFKKTQKRNFMKSKHKKTRIMQILSEWDFFSLKQSNNKFYLKNLLLQYNRKIYLHFQNISITAAADEICFESFISWLWYYLKFFFYFWKSTKL